MTEIYARQNAALASSRAAQAPSPHDEGVGRGPGRGATTSSEINSTPSGAIQSVPVDFSIPLIPPSETHPQPIAPNPDEAGSASASASSSSSSSIPSPTEHALAAPESAEDETRNTSNAPTIQSTNPPIHQSPHPSPTTPSLHHSTTPSPESCLECS